MWAEILAGLSTDLMPSLLELELLFMVDNNLRD